MAALSFLAPTAHIERNSIFKINLQHVTQDLPLITEASRQDEEAGVLRIQMMASLTCHT